MFWRKKKEEQQAADRIDIIKGEENVYVVRIHGSLTADMFKRLRDFGARRIDKVGSVKVLMELVDFRAWEGKASNDDFDFLMKYDALIDKIAVVGDPKFEEGAMLFLGAGRRHADVRFFPIASADAAKSWLKG